MTVKIQKTISLLISKSKHLGFWIGKWVGIDKSTNHNFQMY